LVPDSVTIAMLRKKVESNPGVSGYIFDGFPRTSPQAEALDALLAEKNQSISGLIALEVNEDEIVKRLLNRGKTSGRADDNDEKIIRNRFEVYRSETTPVAKYYGEVKKAYTVKGIGSIEDIFAQLCNKIEALMVH
jgi:adenylate kinase